MSSRGKTIEVYLMDGTMDGRWMVTLANWNGVAFRLQRDDLKKCSDLPEVNTPGVYFLIGIDTSVNRKFVYVGEADDALKRIAQPHNFETKESRWTEALIFISSDEFLDKAKVRYLENRFYLMATECERYVVKNGNVPKRSPLSKKVMDSLEDFIDQVKMTIPIMGHRIFDPVIKDDQADDQDLLFFSRNNGAGGKGVGKKTADGFLVKKGSYIDPKLKQSAGAGIEKLRKLYAKDIGKDRILQRDIEFSSPSAAAAFICGTSSNGLIEWKNIEGVSLKRLEEGPEMVQGEAEPYEVTETSAGSKASTSSKSHAPQGVKVPTKKAPKGTAQKDLKVSEPKCSVAKGKGSPAKKGKMIDKKVVAPGPAKPTNKPDVMPVKDDQSLEQIFYLRQKGIVAMAVRRDQGLLVLKGSGFVKDAVQSVAKYVLDHRASLKADGRVENDRFVEDVFFDSPSGAAACILGGATNGRQAWKDENGVPIKVYQDQAQEEKKTNA